MRRARGGEIAELAVLVHRAAAMDGAERVEQYQLRGGDGGGGEASRKRVAATKAASRSR